MKETTIKIGTKIFNDEAKKNKIEIVKEEQFNEIYETESTKHNVFIKQEEWRQYIKWKYEEVLYAVETNENKDGKVLYEVKSIKHFINTLPSILHIQENLDALFKYHPALNTFIYDSFSTDNIFNGEIYDEDTKPAEIFNFFKRNFGEWCPRIDIKEAIQETLNYNRRNLVADYLETLIWDGEERLETFMMDYYNADDTQLNRVYFKRWMIALIKRIYDPGCKFDNMLILYGEQGKKKSSLFEWLGTLNNKNYCNHLPQDLKDIKQLVYATKNAFIMMNDDFEDICDKGNIGVIKEFVTKRNDRTDLKFKHAKDYPRHYVLCATTNSNNFLSDDKAFDERRFWIIEVNPSTLEFDLTDELKEQLYAEALYLYKENPDMKLWINEPELIEAEKELQKKYKNAYVDPIAEKVVNIFNRKYYLPEKKFLNENQFRNAVNGYEYEETTTTNTFFDTTNEENYNYIEIIPSIWITELVASGKRSADRIIQILHTQGFKVEKLTGYRYDGKIQLTCIHVLEHPKYNS